MGLGLVAGDPEVDSVVLTVLICDCVRVAHGDADTQPLTVPDREGLREPVPHPLAAGERDTVGVTDTNPDAVKQTLKLDDALMHTVAVGLCDTDPEKDSELLVLVDTDTLPLATVDTDDV